MDSKCMQCMYAVLTNHNTAGYTIRAYCNMTTCIRHDIHTTTTTSAIADYFEKRIDNDHYRRI
jgi:hypothetical protein